MLLSVVLAIGTGACAHMRPPVMGAEGRPIGMPCKAVKCRGGTPGGLYYGAQMRFAKLNFDNFSEADLREANLSASDMFRAKFRFADLRGAQLRGANLTRAVLMKANLRDADPAGALLRGADLRSAKLQGANIAYADLDGALLPAGIGEHEGPGSGPGPR